MEKFYDKGLHFECKRCSYCCGHAPGVVYLSERDLDSLCGFFKMGREEFIEKNCRWVEYYYGDTVLALKEKKNYDCWLWDNGCTAYEARPLQCSTYPFWSWMVADRETWYECARDCPGMNSGRLWPVEQIEEQKTLYDANVPLSIKYYQKLASESPEEQLDRNN